MATPIHAILLFSGGLDSQLSAMVLQEQGITVHPVFFDSPFVDSTRAKSSARMLELELHIVNFFPDMVTLLKSPKHGFGACLNPCIDCHIQMFRRAGELMKQMGAHFLASGEVLGQRPMSQTMQTLALVARESGYQDLILRPLSALLLPETSVERAGLVKRSLLFGIHGRSRKVQMELARKYALKDIPCSAGGCRLTEPNFCKRLEDLIKYGGFDNQRQVRLLQYGRHFRISEKAKLIVGRNKTENELLEADALPDEILLKNEVIPGPSAILSGTVSDEEIKLSAGICARYSDVNKSNPVTVCARYKDRLFKTNVYSIDIEHAEKLRI